MISTSFCLESFQVVACLFYPLWKRNWWHWDETLLNGMYLSYELPFFWGTQEGLACMLAMKAIHWGSQGEPQHEFGSQLWLSEMMSSFWLFKELSFTTQPHVENDTFLIIERALIELYLHPNRSLIVITLKIATRWANGEQFANFLFHVPTMFSIRLVSDETSKEKDVQAVRVICVRMSVA